MGGCLLSLSHTYFRQKNTVCDPPFTTISREKQPQRRSRWESVATKAVLAYLWSCLFFNFPALLFHCSRWITLSPPSLLSSSRHRRRLSQPIFALVISTAYMVRNLGAGELFILASWLVGWRHWCGGGSDCTETFVLGVWLAVRLSWALMGVFSSAHNMITPPQFPFIYLPSLACLVFGVWRAEPFSIGLVCYFFWCRSLGFEKAFWGGGGDGWTDGWMDAI